MEQPISTATAYTAFVTAQAQFKAAIKDANNPHYRSKYADLQSIYDAAVPHLHLNGISVTQPVRISEHTGFAYVETVVRYQDGTVIESSQCPVICKVQNDPQAMGSAITYARRYSLASILCVVTDDDDAESATDRGNTNRNPPAKAAPVPVLAQKAPLSITVDLTNWQLSADACTDADDLNRLKKDIGGAGLEGDNFKAVWGLLNKRAKSINCTYNTTSKQFSQP